ncbi:MAG: tryptophan-rich sensory protein [Bacteroidales bacterium]
MKYRVVNLVLFVVMVVVNYLANALPINGITTGQISEMYPNLFVPAGITFSIWGVIYLMLLVFVILQFGEKNKIIVQQIGWFFALSCALNALWIFAWHYEMLLISLLIMLTLLATLIFINLKLHAQPNGFIKAAFGIYLGWISIATIANVTALLVSINWGAWGLSHEAWAIIMILVGAAITALAIIKINNLFIGLAVIWAFMGIIVKRQDDYQSIVIASIVGIVLVGATAIYKFMKSGVKKT